MPECKPSIDSKPNTPETVGYTERVAVSSGRQIESAVAKSDTGARRTSIDIDLVAAIGAGPLVDTTQVKSGTRAGRQKRPLVVGVKLGNQWHSTTASTEDEATCAIPCSSGAMSCEDIT